MIRLNSNESPFGPSRKAIEAMQASALQANLYPDNDARPLCQKLAERHRVGLPHILVGAGSTDLIGILCRTLLKSSRNAVTSQRSFIIYSLATEAAGARLIETPMRNNALDLEAVASAMGTHTSIVFLANPNNPTGTLFDASALDRFLSQVPDHVTVVLDEAYYDYAKYFAQARGIDYSHSLDYVRQGRNVVVLRTFSKAYGLAGVRVGYAMGPAELISSLARARTTYSISTAAQAAAQAALDDDAHVAYVLENNFQGAEWLLGELRQLGYEPVPTWANFLYCELGQDAQLVAQHLKEQGVLVRPLAAWGARQAIRITIGTAGQNQQFLAAFKKLPRHNK